jgi:hypothetical protein
MLPFRNGRQEEIVSSDVYYFLAHVYVIRATISSNVPFQQHTSETRCKDEEKISSHVAFPRREYRLNNDELLHAMVRIHSDITPSSRYQEYERKIGDKDYSNRGPAKE